MKKRNALFIVTFAVVFAVVFVLEVLHVGTLRHDHFIGQVVTDYESGSRS